MLGSRALVAFVGGMVLGATLVATPASAEPDRSPPVAEAQTGDSFVPLEPRRVLDTRNGTGAPRGTVGPRQVITVDLSSTAIPSTTTAVVLNVTVVSPTAATFVTVYTAGQVRPGVSNVHVAAGDIRANQVTVQVSDDNRISLYNNAGNTHLVADLSGRYEHTLASRFTALTPKRVLDTRFGAMLGPGATTTLDLTDRVPASASAVTFNLTAIRPTAATFLTAWPSGATRPSASSLNVGPGDIRPNLVTVPVGGNRRVSLYNNSGWVDVAVDLSGFYTVAFGSYFRPLTPTRVVDTRDSSGSLGPGQFLDVGPNVGSNTTSMLLNVTGVQPTTATWLGAWTPRFNDQTTPEISTLNLSAGEIAANLAVVEFRPGGTPLAYNNSGRTHLVADLAGIFVSPAASCTTDCAYAWGDNDRWQLGTGLRTDSGPTKVADLPSVTAQASAMDGWTRYALLTDGTVRAWGENRAGQLGAGWFGGMSPAPVAVSGLTGVTTIATTHDSAFALRSDGTAWVWGLAATSTGEASPVPVRIAGLNDVTGIVTGRSAVFLLRAGGTVWAWGPSQNDPGWAPVRVEGLTDVVSVAAQQAGGIAARADGTVWTWRHGGTPAQLPGLTDVTAVAAGDLTGYALRADGTVWSWGDGHWGQLGTGVDCVDEGPGCFSDVPVRVVGLTDVVALPSGYLRLNGYALRSDGTAWAWGEREFLGSPVGRDTSTPRQVSLPPGVTSLSGAGAVAG